MSMMYVSREQYNSLPPIGMELLDFWLRRRPELCRDMQNSGILWDTLSFEGARLHTMLLELVSAGESVDAAVETVRADYRARFTVPVCA